MSPTSTLEQFSDHDFGVGGQRDGEQAYRRAIRHSRRVRFLRRAIPLIVASILGLTVLVQWLDPLRVLARLPGSAEGLVISGTKITMAAPKLSGFTSDSRRYELTARSAAQDIANPNVIELAAVNATIEADARNTVHVTSEEGTYDRASGMLTLRRDVKFKSSSGYDVRLEEAVINTGSGEMVSEKPVDVFTEQGTVRADRMEVENAGEVIRFVGGVIVNLPSRGEDAQPADKP